MIDERIKKRASCLVEKAKKNNLVKSYNEWSKTKEAKEYAMPEEEVIYYTSRCGRSK